MNKRAGIHTFVSLKTYIILIAIGIVAYYLYYFYILHSMGIAIIPSSCPQEIIPDRLGNLSCQYGSCSNQGGRSYWTDGTEISYYLICSKGAQQGQNVNYAYCDIHYNKQVVSSSGEIGKPINMAIVLAIDTNDKTDEGYKVVGSTCKS